MTLPRHVLNRFLVNTSVRLPKRTECEEIQGMCPMCSKPVGKKIICGIKQPDGIWHNGVYYHYDCRAKLISHSDESEALHNREGKLKLPKGNLGREEYRYWIGMRDAQNSKWAMCRVCRTCTWGPEERAAHFQMDRFRVNGDSCSTRLIKALEHLKSSPVCIVCKKQRWGSVKWGVPICDQLTCHTAWMFDAGTKWAQLYLLLNAQLDKADFLKQQAEARQRAIREAAEEVAYSKDPCYARCVSSNMHTQEETTRWWCNLCTMFADQSHHAEIHELHLQTLKC